MTVRTRNVREAFTNATRKIGENKEQERARKRATATHRHRHQQHHSRQQQQKQQPEQSNNGSKQRQRRISTTIALICDAQRCGWIERNMYANENGNVFRGSDTQAHGFASRSRDWSTLRRVYECYSSRSIATISCIHFATFKRSHTVNATIHP